MSMKSKYKKKYARQLLDGMRADGKSIVECCLAWGISDTTYYNWIEQYPEFKHAAEQGNLQCAAWWHKTHRDITTGEIKGNASTANFAMKNVDKIKYVDKSEVHTTHDEQIRTIKIEMLSPRLLDNTKVIDVDPE